jgi:hypothetical protein
MTSDEIEQKISQLLGPYNVVVALGKDAVDDLKSYKTRRLR